MANSISGKVNLAPLLDPSLKQKTGRQAAELSKEQTTLVNKALNERLQEELLRLKNEIAASVPAKSKEVEQVFEKIGAPDYSTVGSKSLAELITTGMPETLKKKFSEDELRRIQDVVAIAAHPGDITAMLHLDLPLTQNPILAPQILSARISEFAKLAGLKTEAITLLLQKNFQPDQLDDASLDEMVKDKVITAAQKNDLVFSSLISRASGGNTDVLTAVREKKIASPVELAGWEKEDWVKTIKEKKITLPANEESAESYAQNLVETLESSFPTEFFLTRVITKSPVAEFKSMASAVEPLLKKKLRLFEGENNRPVTFSDDDWKEIPANKRSQVQSAIASLRPMVNTYRYLDINAVLEKKDTIEAKQSEITRRIGALDTFYKNNPALDIYADSFSVDLSVKNNAAFNWTGIDVALQPMVQKQMAAFQRAYVLGDDQGTATKLLKNGFDSALRIVSMTEEDFILESGMSRLEGRKVYKKAGDLATGAAHYFAAIRDGVKNVYNKIKVGNQHPLMNDLKEIDGFDKLFGNQDFCDCEHCRSIFSPAAYFCDLMYFVQEHVSKKLFTGSNALHPLYLKRRRPDLWKLTLTCDHTSTEIPYLQVVNEVLENYLQVELGVADIYEVLKSAALSVRQPFNLWLEETRLYLGHFDLSLYDVYRDMKAPARSIHRERLRLSPAELSIITVADTAGVKKRFGSKSLGNFNVQEFITYAGITRRQLDDLLKTGLIPEIAQVKVKTIRDTSDIQKSSEQLENLTDARLDLIHRYLRLWRKTAWTLREFDLVLSSLKAKGLLNNLEHQATGYEKVLQLAPALIFQQRLGLGVEELATIIHELPQNVIIDNQQPFASRVFNLTKIADPAVSDKIPYVLAGLGITEAELGSLSSLLTISLSQPFTIPVLSDLYRHARIARGLGMTITDFTNALRLVLNGQPVRSFDDVQKLVDFCDWLKKTSLKVSDVIFIVLGTESGANQYEHTIDTLAAKVLEIQKEEAVTKEPVAATRLAIKQSLLRNYILSSFNITAAQLDNQFLTQLLPATFTASATTALNAVFVNDQPVQSSDFNNLLDLLHRVERFDLLFSRHEFTPENITYIIDHKAVFGIADLKSLTLADLVNISFYRELIRQDADAAASIQDALSAFQSAGSFAGHESALAGLWEQPAALISSLLNNITLTAPAINAMRELEVALELCVKLGIQGDSLKKLLGNDYKVASGIALGAFSSKYPNEATRKEKLEPYADKLNTLKRDALCDYIISREDKFKFKDLTDLYAFFLLDVEMSGCFRTSYLVAAITSLQLYVLRCLTNLEQSDPNLNPSIDDLKVLPTWIPADEWEWRKNYRVWEANRRVFLHAENYIDPTLRDTRTHLFKDLEDELLQQKITKESAETAYKKYMAQFAELTRLRYAGAYYHSTYDNYGYANLGDDNSYLVTDSYFPSESDDSCYYLFARTNVLPYQYFYRTYNHNRKTWSNWLKIELGIEAKEISALIHQGRLYIFWLEVKNKELNSVSDGNSTSTGFVFTGYVKYSYLTENGKWSAPQRLFVGQDTETQQKIYGRGRNTTSYSPTRWEEEKDAIVEAFQEKVFRKPYAFRRPNDTADPIGLGFIWSNNKGSSTVQYTSNGLNYAVEIPYCKISFNVPSRTFSVVNNDFSGAVASVPITLSIETPVNNWTESGTGTIQMSPGMCLFLMTVAGIDFDFPVGYSSNQLPPPVKESEFKVSLSRNLITNPAEQHLFSGSSLGTYMNEYDVAYTETGETVHYIENGSKGMSSDKISQSREGLGGIHIYGDSAYEYVGANTILTDQLTDILYARGVEQFLSLQTQEMTDNAGQQFDFRGPYGEYYWEIFFHIPFLIANHFNANQKFAEAKWWYERIFNPTSEETPASTNPTDHNWQFREFRGLTPQKLKDLLTDVKAIEVYKKDPFDPHAIARLRISAYQKCIVMKYIDNLVDWGDYLFTKDTRESINEAEMLYRLAQSILGKRPVKMGKCETADENTLTYEKIGPQIGSGSEFLITLENVYLVERRTYDVGVGLVKNGKSLAAAAGYRHKDLDLGRLQEIASVKRIYDGLKKLPAPPSPQPSVAGKAGWKASRVKSYTRKTQSKAALLEKSAKWGNQKDVVAKSLVDNLKFKKNKRFPAYDIVKQTSTVFCIPENQDLLKYWDTVEDRLFKIWNCMNIKGIRRSLSLFQPPIDPMMLVRLKAAGLSLEDILAVVLGTGTIPNYRFTYLIEKAKQYTQIVQGFGAALLSALEKKDTEELLLLHTTHEKNILQLQKEIRKSQLKEAQYQYKATQDNLTNAQNRVDYYQGLIDTGLIPWEIAEQVAKWTAGSIRIGEATFGFLASVFGFLPQIGSPFAMKYGGQELKNGTKSLQDATGTLAAIADNVAILAGLEAGHQRREQEWKHQLLVSQREYTQLNNMLLAADVKQQMAEKELEMHEKHMEQLDALNDFYKNKFTSLGLYNYLASGLNRTYRAGYNIAYQLAKLAERAYQFERYDNTFYIQGDNWEFDRAGLLSGERLLQQLMGLEKKYIDTNSRKPEIMQSFSLALLDSSQLLQLRQTGTCTIKIPEIAFEIYYPGQYRRVIKSVRVTIPCVTGPYTNISARLTLLKGEIEEAENDALKEIDIAKNTSITTSSANNDAGLFELNFQDERYLPFEGAGAISQWRLELPSMLRSFNYDTIPDVIMHISYTSLEGNRAAAETALGTSFVNFATANGLYRLFSLKYDFPDAFARLFFQPAQQTEFNVDKMHFPYIIAESMLSVVETKVYLKPKKASTVTVPSSLKVNGNNNVTWAAGEDIALPGTSTAKNKIKGGTVTLGGDPVKKWTLDAGTNGLNKNDLDDVLVLLKYRVDTL